MVWVFDWSPSGHEPFGPVLSVLFLSVGLDDVADLAAVVQQGHGSVVRASCGVAHLFQDHRAVAEGRPSADVLHHVRAVRVALAREDVQRVVDVEGHQHDLAQTRTARVDRLVGLAEDRAGHREIVQVQDSRDVD